MARSGFRFCHHPASHIDEAMFLHLPVVETRSRGPKIRHIQHSTSSSSTATAMLFQVALTLGPVAAIHGPIFPKCNPLRPAILSLPNQGASCICGTPCSGGYGKGPSGSMSSPTCSVFFLDKCLPDAPEQGLLPLSSPSWWPTLDGVQLATMMQTTTIF